MELKTYPNPVLSKKCEDVEIGDLEAPAILEEMSKKLYEWEGVGLAAPQVGVLKKMVVIDVRNDPSTLYKMINPKIVWRSEDSMVESEEDCLSLPGVHETVMRYERVRVEYLNEHFEKCSLEADGLLSRCIQHELDHLDGKLYIDRLSKLKKSRLLAKFKKLQDEKSLEEKYED